MATIEELRKREDWARNAASGVQQRRASLQYAHDEAVCMANTCAQSAEAYRARAREIEVEASSLIGATEKVEAELKAATAALKAAEVEEEKRLARERQEATARQAAELREREAKEARRLAQASTPAMSPAEAERLAEIGRRELARGRP